jgi:hypothetical protein
VEASASWSPPSVLLGRSPPRAAASGGAGHGLPVVDSLPTGHAANRVQTVGVASSLGHDRP